MHQSIARRRALVANKILAIFNRQGNRDYIGETVSQLSHAVQCAKLAKTIPESVLNGGNTHEFVTAALCHDIGHLLIHEPYKIFPKPLEKLEYIDRSNGPRVTVDLGVKNHETVGALYMRRLGFSAYTYTLIRNHVLAKRYLITTTPSYAEKMSSASKATFCLQGGNMTNSELDHFSKSQFFGDSLLLRYIDDLAKTDDLPPKKDCVKKLFLSDLYGALSF